jgi:outer membrane immunogenic protein
VVGKFAWLAASVIALTGPALAADLSEPYRKAPVLEAPGAPLWSGWYLGAQGGFTESRADFKDLDFFVDGGSHNASKTGGLAGGHVGYNWQDRGFVYGLETDFNWVDAEAGGRWGYSGFNRGASYAYSSSIDWMGSIRGRAGLDYGPALLYVTGGLAYADVQNKVSGFSQFAKLTDGGFADGKVRLGWTAGIGVEHLLPNNMIARAELRYTDLGTDTVNGGGNGNIGLYRGQFSNQTVTGLLGVSYKFPPLGDALAADAPVYGAKDFSIASAAPAWGGWYVGVQGGIAQAYATYNDLDYFGDGGSHDLSKTGGIAGGNLGYNWQNRSFVYGLEADINWVDAKTSQSWGAAGVFRGATYTQSSSVDWMGSIRGRAGLDYGTTLLYVTGGLAYAGVHNDASGLTLFAATPHGAMTDNKTKLGWTAGAGVEHLFGDHLTARAELRYTDLGSDTVNGTGGGTASLFRGQFSNELLTAMAGVGYKLGASDGTLEGASALSFKDPAMDASLPSWAGWYIGAQGGIAQNYSNYNDLDFFVDGGSHDLSKTGGIAGGNLGYNWLYRGIVYGLETDLNWVGAKAGEVWGSSPATRCCVYSQSGDIGWVGSFRGRIGLDYGPTLLYATGGLAYGGVKNGIDGFSKISIGVVPGAFADDKTRLGWTAGLGVEHVFDSHLTLRAEVRYIDLGSDIVTAAGVAPVNTDHAQFSNQLVTGLIGIGYKF